MSGSTPEKIHTSVLDTRELARETFLPAVALLQGYNMESMDELRYEYYGEYLSQGRLSSDGVVTTTLGELIAYGLYNLYPPFADVVERNSFWSRVLQLRKAFTGPPKELIGEEVETAQTISQGCFPDLDIRPVVMMTLLSLQPRYRLEPRILEAFKNNGSGMKQAQRSDSRHNDR